MSSATDRIANNTAAGMTQDERRHWLIDALINEDARLANLAVPPDEIGQRELLRALMNIREPRSVSDDFLSVQDAYLHERSAERGIATLEETVASSDARIRLWKGDITTLAVDAITNAANSQMLGCFVAGHHCIDNAIHTYAGVQLRLECNRLMRAQGHPEPTGSAKLTPAYNLPARYVIHTVGPIVAGPYPTARDAASLRRCYRCVLAAAKDAGCDSIALCCISTGVFHYPNADAAALAVDVVRDYLANTDTDMTIVFNVFLDIDEALYRNLLDL